MAKHNELGKLGEDLATKHLEEKGYRIIARNWRFGRDELDIIATFREWLVITEVKTRTTDRFGEPEVAVTPAKQRSIIKAAEGYIFETNYRGETRFDVIGILLGNGKVIINHIEDAFLPRMK